MHVGAYLYGCECWWSIDDISEQILSIERKLLKTILKVKPNDIIYVELNRPDIISKIKQCQEKFYKKCKMLQQDEAVVREVLGLGLGLGLQCKTLQQDEAVVREVLGLGLG